MKLSAELKALLAPIPPPAEDHYRPRRRKRTWRVRLILWAILLGIFLAAYQLFNGSGPRLEPEARPGAAASLLMEIPFVSGVTFFAIFGVLMLAMFRRRKKFRSQTEKAELLRAGDLERAEPAIETLCRGAQQTFHLHASYVCSRAVTCMYRGDFERARVLLAAALRSGAWDANPLAPFAPAALAQMAFLYALEGDLVGAEAWRSAAHRIAPTARHATFVTVDAVLGLRRGEYERVAGLLASRWMDAEGTLTPFDLKGLRILRAFALRHLPGNPERLELYEATMSAVVPLRPGQLDYLGAHWPELAGFIREEGLARAA